MAFYDQLLQYLKDQQLQAYLVGNSMNPYQQQLNQLYGNPMGNPNAFALQQMYQNQQQQMYQNQLQNANPYYQYQQQMANNLATVQANPQPAALLNTAYQYPYPPAVQATAKPFGNPNATLLNQGSWGRKSKLLNGAFKYPY